MQNEEEEGQARMVGMFSRMSHAAPDYVKQIWTREQSLCGAREGHWHRGRRGNEISDRSYNTVPHLTQPSP